LFTTLERGGAGKMREGEVREGIGEEKRRG